MKRRLRHLTQTFLIALAARLLRTLAATLRWRMNAANAAQLRLLQAPETPPVILCLWHNRVLMLLRVWDHHLRRRRPRAFVLTSLSNDGEMLARFAGKFGFGAARGSARRRGPEALRELVALLKDGHDVAVTPDGSRGPVYRLKGGVVLLAQLSGCPILPVHLEYSKCWRLRSWDQFLIPKPFARAELIFGEPLTVPLTQTDEEFEAARVRCEAAMLAVVRRK